MRKEVKNTKDVKYKAILFSLYQEKRDWRKKKEDDGWTGYDSESD